MTIWDEDACPTIEQWWLISVGMIADTPRPAADDASTSIKNLAGTL
jgi:hypothetical protein